MVTLIITGLLGIVLASYLTMVSSQQTMTARSQSWNTCISLAEAGVEEALTHLNINGTTNIHLASQGWVYTNSVYFMTRELDFGYYDVSIAYGLNPVITSTGYAPAPNTVASSGSSVGAFLAKAGDKGTLGLRYIARTVQVVCQNQGSLNKAIVARDKVVLNGKNVDVDSFDSSNPSSSTPTNGSAWGVYDAAKRRDNGDVAVIEGLSDTLTISSAKVYGRVSTGPAGDIKLNKNATVGSLAWHTAGNTGVQPGYSSSDASFSMPPVVKPYNSAVTPSGGFVGTNYYDTILAAGDWKISQFKGKVYVSGDARLLVTAKVEFKDGASDDDGIEFGPGGRLQLYVDCQDATIVGKKTKKKAVSLQTSFNEDGNATNFVYYGTDKNTTLQLSKMDEYVGVIYAPNANVTLKAGSPKYYHCNVYGSISGYRITLEKNAHFHYDEALVATDSLRKYIISSWKEL